MATRSVARDILFSWKKKRNLFLILHLTETFNIFLCYLLGYIGWNYESYAIFFAFNRNTVFIDKIKFHSQWHHLKKKELFFEDFVLNLRFDGMKTRN